VGGHPIYHDSMMIPLTISAIRYDTAQRNLVMCIPAPHPAWYRASTENSDKPSLLVMHHILVRDISGA